MIIAAAPATPGAPDEAALQQAVTDAQRAFTEADEALRAGDLAAYQQKTEEAQAAVERARVAMGG